MSIHVTDFARDFPRRALSARASRGTLVKAALQDPAFFAAYVLRDEHNRSVQLASMHEAWHDLISKNDRVVIWSHVEAGKTQQVGIARVLWELGRNPNMSVCILSNTHRMAVRTTMTLAQYIERSDALHAVYPHLKPGRKWTDDTLHVQRTVLRNDPSIQAKGVHGDILGSRIDLLVIDDILDWENCRNERQREDLKSWVKSTVMGRLMPDARVVVIGNAYHPEDLLHEFATTPGFTAVRYPVVDDATGEPRWPERWPAARIERKRTELGPLEFARQMLCKPFDERTNRCQQAWIDQCLKRGEGKEFAYALDRLPPGYKVITGVDLAVQQHSAADLTCLFTIAIHPNGDREVINVESGRWSGPDIMQRIIDTHRRYNSIFIIENNAAQDWMLQFTGSRSAVPMRPFNTGRNKAHPEFGVESLFVELYNAKWIIPSRGGRPAHPELAAWVRDMMFYNPAEHVGDRLMASWFAREGVRMAELRIEAGHLDLHRR